MINYNKRQLTFPVFLSRTLVHPFLLFTLLVGLFLVFLMLAIAHGKQFADSRPNLDLYSPRNDPDPEIISNPEMIPKLTPK